MRYLPNNYAKLACEKLYREGYEMKPHDIYYAHKLNEYNPKRKLILSLLFGMAVNEYQRLKIINQKIVKE